jgi:hypothetical protein
MEECMSQPNIFQEIEDDIERQKWEDLWRRYGPYIVGGALVIVLTTAAITAWRSHRSEHNQAATDGLMTILNKAGASRAEEVKSLGDFAQKNAGTAQGTLAQLYNAAAVAKDGDKVKAVALYDEVAHDAKADPALRQFADLMAVQIQVDSADPGTLRARLKPLWADGAPWRYTALNLEGHLALKAGDKNGARQAFSSLAHDGSAPAHLSEDATEMLRYIGE